MKQVLVPEKFDLVDNVNKFKGKVKIKEFFKKKLPECIGIIVGTSISAFFSSGLNVMGMFILATYTAILFLNERYSNKRIAKKNLDNSMCLDGHSNLLDDLELDDFSNAVTYSRKPKDECCWLLDGKGRVDNKKVISYIAIPQKCKLIVFKQIINNYKYENNEMQDIADTQMFLLEEEDLIKERIITDDYYLNDKNPLGKKLINSPFYR